MLEKMLQNVNALGIVISIRDAFIQSNRHIHHHARFNRARLGDDRRQMLFAEHDEDRHCAPVAQVMIVCVQLDRAEV